MREAENLQELQRLYERFGGEMSEAVLKAWWTRRHPEDEMSWDMRRASSTALAYMEQDLMQMFGAIDAAGYVIVEAGDLEPVVKSMDSG